MTAGEPRLARSLCEIEGSCFGLRPQKNRFCDHRPENLAVPRPANRAIWSCTVAKVTKAVFALFAAGQPRQDCRFLEPKYTSPSVLQVSATEEGNKELLVDWDSAAFGVCPASVPPAAPKNSGDVGPRSDTENMISTGSYKSLWHYPQTGIWCIAETPSFLLKHSLSNQR